MDKIWFVVPSMWIRQWLCFSYCLRSDIESPLKVNNYELLKLKSSLTTNEKYNEKYEEEEEDMMDIQPEIPYTPKRSIQLANDDVSGWDEMRCDNDMR